MSPTAYILRQPVQAKRPSRWDIWGSPVLVDTGGLFVNMPIDHNAQFAIANVPFGQGSVSFVVEIFPLQLFPT